MNNILIYSDLHINIGSLKECFMILEEIGMLANQYKCDTLINCGDTFDFYLPKSQELDLFSTFIRRLGPSKQHIIISADSHESETKSESIVNHFGILADNVQVIKEFIDGNKLYCGHFGLSEAKLNKFGATHSVDEFSKFKTGVFGHYHSWEQVNKNCYQLGASRFVDFSESQDPDKKVLLIEGYDTDEPKLTFIPLKSCIPMMDIVLDKPTSPETLQAPITPKRGRKSKATLEAEKSISQAQESQKTRHFCTIGDLITFLDKTDPNTKIRVIYRDYSLFSDFLKVSQRYKDKFIQFSDKKEFIISTNNQKGLVETKKDLKDSLTKWMTINKTELKIQEVLLKEIK